MKPEPMKTQHEVLTCPACGLMIRAEVTIEPNLGAPSISTTRHVTVPINPTIERFVIVHHCSGRASIDASRDEVSTLPEIEAAQVIDAHNQLRRMVDLLEKGFDIRASELAHWALVDAGLDQAEILRKVAPEVEPPFMPEATS